MLKRIDINLPRGVTGISIDCAALSDEMVEALIAFALQSRITNAFASMQEKDGHDVESWTDEAHRHVAEAESGEMRFGTGGGGARLDSVEIECRSIVAQALRKKGSKVAEANKLAVQWRKHVPADAVEKIIAKAQAIVATKGDLDIEL